MKAMAAEEEVDSADAGGGCPLHLQERACAHIQWKQNMDADVLSQHF
ncbi:abhydrolase domain containing 5, isoform CRA_c [Mus musculus]|uniref:Abhydrolase domain containing 5 n=1 Tax=Mus musculus TaxID=10090 RepID=H3BLJ0_MOUSE|nr:abhydrolase domain containing 5, isoform CRA_c [Mus musculus]